LILMSARARPRPSPSSFAALPKPGTRVAEQLFQGDRRLELHAGVAPGVDAILILEIPFHLEKVAAKCIERSRYGKLHHHRRLRGGDARGRPPLRRADRSGLARSRSLGRSRQIRRSRGGEAHRARVARHGSRLRPARRHPPPHDRLLATEFGFHAFELIMKGRFGELVVRRDGRIGTISIREVTGKIRTVPPDPYPREGGARDRHQPRRLSSRVHAAEERHDRLLASAAMGSHLQYAVCYRCRVASCLEPA
jgi:hypothetical protein